MTKKFRFSVTLKSEYQNEAWEKLEEILENFIELDGKTLVIDLCKDVFDVEEIE